MIDKRLSKQTVNRRPTRAAQNRAVTEDREQTDADRLAAFRQMHAEAALPNLPPIPGFHVCWLTTGNNKDTLQARHRLGYVPIPAEKLKGFGEFATGQGGEVNGLVHVNEMVAYMLPIELYNLYMVENHHNEPLRQEGMLTDKVQAISAAAKEEGTDVDAGDGIEALEKLNSIRVPDFTEDA